MTNQRFKLDTQAYITLAYLTAVAVGMMFDYKYYREFSINIFEYADILDFLLAPVKNLEVIVFVGITFAFVFTAFWLDKLWQTRAPKTYKRMNFGVATNTINKYRPFVILFSTIAYLSYASEFYSDRMHEKFEEKPRTIEVVYESGNKVISGNFIGKNSTYIFIQSADKAVKAIPVASDVQEIVIDRP